MLLCKCRSKVSTCNFRPHPGETRQIYIEKSTEALGITIKENQAKKGVFINSVSENSLANQVGLQVKIL